jgi:cation diffusion facilitator family transporter
MASESNLSIYASIAANVIIGGTKLTAAALSSSSAMIAEGVHSLVDASDGTLLLIGRRRSRKPPDETHPFGHGKELYFWTLIVAVIFFAVGGGVSVYEGILRLLHPEPLRDPTLAYIVLAVATVFDGGSLVVGLRALHRAAPGQSIAHVVREGKDPSLFTVVLEDIADLAGIAIAFLGVWLGHRLGSPHLDGAASIGVGLVLATVATILVVQCRTLLVGERASDAVLAAVRDAAEASDAMTRIERPLTMQLGPHDVLLALGVQFEPDITAEDVSRAVASFEAGVRERRPEVRHIYVEAHSLRRDA